MASSGPSAVPSVHGSPRSPSPALVRPQHVLSPGGRSQITAAPFLRESWGAAVSRLSHSCLNEPKPTVGAEVRASALPRQIVLSTNRRKSKNFCFQVVNSQHFISSSRAPHISAGSKGASSERPPDERNSSVLSSLLGTRGFLLEIYMIKLPSD